MQYKHFCHVNVIKPLANSHMRLITTLCILMLLAGTGYAQPITITGSVSDTLNSNPLPNACITILRAKDSVLETFTRTRQDGSFSFKVKDNGKYLLMTSYPGLAEYVDIFNVNDKKDVNLGLIPMVSKVHLLKEVVLTQQYAAIKVKGDTIEYMADSFLTKENADVEALLKKLPGIQVDKNGQIVAHGEKVEKVLVDGEEFFTDDPAVVTKSLQAKAVDKVQVFDKKSDQAEFTGIDDGEKTRTINLQLKEDKKKGYFGKLVGAGGAGDDQGYFENQAMFNAFKGKRKLSVFGIMANTGKMGLGWEDRDKFGGGGGNSFMDEDGGFVTYYTSGDDDMESWNGQYNGEGYPRAWTAGGHFSNKWNKDKHHLGSNYRYAKQDISAITNTLNENSLPGNKKNFTDQTNDKYSLGQRHRADGNYTWTIDSSSSLKLTANAGISNTQSTTNYKSETVNELDSALNTNNRVFINDATTKSINATLDWRKKFKKKGRTISLNMTENYRETVSEGFLKFNTTIFLRDTNTNNLLGKVNDIRDQRKDNESKNMSLSAKLTYTEPLSKVAFIDANYSFKVDNNMARRETYNRQTPTDDSYKDLDTFFSNNFMFNVMTHTGGANLRFVLKKLTMAAGGSVSNASFKQEDLMNDTSRNYNFTNFFPKAYIKYNINKQRRLSLDYSGYTQQPTIDQIQPLRNNLDPLNIAIGNAGITQSFTHNVGVSFNDYKMLTNRYIWMNFNMNFIDNAISRSETIDAGGRRTYQYINVDGNYSGWGYIGLGRQFNKINFDAGIYGSLGLNHINNVINNVTNKSDNNRYSVGLRFSWHTENDKFDISYNPEITYNDNKSTVNTLTTSYWTTEQEFEVSYELPLKFEIGTDINWFIRQQTSVFDRNNNVFRWNAYVAKKFMKNDQLELRLSAFDMLNQNLGFSRYAQNNIVTETNYNTIRRYGLLSLTWNFTKTAAGAAPEQDAGTIIKMIK